MYEPSRYQDHKELRSSLAVYQISKSRAEVRRIHFGLRSSVTSIASM
jgi:hypothetical protein